MFPPSESYPGLHCLPEHHVLPRPADPNHTLPAWVIGAASVETAAAPLGPNGLVWRDTEDHGAAAAPGPPGPSWDLPLALGRTFPLPAMEMEGGGAQK